MKISVTIVAYRNYPDILAAIQSIRRFTDPALALRIYVVDNSQLSGSTEQQRFVNELEDLNVTYIDTKANIGFGAGHNKVLHLLDSDYHAIVNPDILLFEDS